MKDPNLTKECAEEMLVRLSPLAERISELGESLSQKFRTILSFVELAAQENAHIPRGRMDWMFQKIEREASVLCPTYCFAQEVLSVCIECRSDLRKLVAVASEEQDRKRLSRLPKPVKTEKVKKEPQPAALLIVKGSDPWKNWILEAADHCGFTSFCDFVEAALADKGNRAGFSKAAPKRWPKAKMRRR